MEKKLVVHTGALPGAPLVEERKILEQDGIELVCRGRCATPEQVLEAVKDADVALCGGEPYTALVFAGAPRLKSVIRYGIGVDTVDLDAATEYGVMVGNFPDFCIREVANHALVLILTCAKKIVQLDHGVRQGDWNAARALRIPMGTIHGETLGLVAFGNIARALAERARVLGMNVIAYDPFVPQEAFAQAGVESVSLEELAARSDYVSCHLPLTKSTRGIIDAAFLSRMKRTAYLINTSRGPVVNEPDLIAALKAGTIAGAGLDVFEREPIQADNPLLGMYNVILTPHTASYADQTFETLYQRVGYSALAVLQGGEPQCVANPAVLSHRRR